MRFLGAGGLMRSAVWVLARFLLVGGAGAVDDGGSKDTAGRGCGVGNGAVDDEARGPGEGSDGAGGGLSGVARARGSAVSLRTRIRTCRDAWVPAPCVLPE